MLKIDLTECLNSPHKLQESVLALLDSKAREALTTFDVNEESILNDPTYHKLKVDMSNLQKEIASAWDNPKAYVKGSSEQKNISSLLKKQDVLTAKLNAAAKKFWSVNEGYAITGSGMRPLQAINLQPNQFVYMGASSSPDGIFITKVDSDYITYLQYPYTTKEYKIETRIGMDLISTGINTWLDSAYTRYHPETAKKLQAILDGKKVKPDDIKDYRYVSVVVVPSDKIIKAADNYHRKGDVWGYIENKLQIGVSGMSTVKGVDWYELSGAVESDLPKIKKLFAKVKVSKRKDG